jgi:hypothetical protein
MIRLSGQSMEASHSDNKKTKRLMSHWSNVVNCCMQRSVVTTQLRLEHFLAAVDAMDVREKAKLESL